MELVDKNKQAQIIYEMSKDSLFYKRQLEQDAKVNQKVAAMKLKLDKLSVTQKQQYTRTAVQRSAEIEESRCFDRICCVLDMDMFFAAVEIRDQPHLKDLPVAVGGRQYIQIELIVFIVLFIMNVSVSSSTVLLNPRSFNYALLHMLRHLKC